MCTTEGIAKVGLGAQAAGAAYGTINDFYGAKSQKSAAYAKAEIMAINARLADMSAKQAMIKGEKTYQDSRMATAGLKSKQRVAMAANGIDMSSATAANVLTTTDYMGEIDADTIQSNTIQEAFGYATEKTNLENQASETRAAGKAISPWMAGGTGLLTRGQKVAESWYAWEKASGGKATGKSKGKK